MNTNNSKHNDESNFHVCVRIRPTCNPSFYREGHKEGMKYIRGGPNNSILLIQPYTTQGDKVFIYDEVFDHDSNTKDIFEKAVLPNISDSLFKGFSHTILVYGMTGSGKTFTMFGETYIGPQPIAFNIEGNEPQHTGGMARGSRNGEPSEVEVDGPLKNDQQKELNNYKNGGIVTETVKFVLDRHSENSKIKLKMSYLEIYNEQIRDLLQTETLTAENLTILEDPEKEIENNGKTTTFLTPKLFLVDLAGSERAAATENKGIRLKEGGNINKSLLSLGNCITVLAQQGNDKKKRYVPYRDSKLTRLLKESLGGNAKTLFIGCVTPAFRFVEETVNTLQYAQRAKSIQKEVFENVKQIYNQIEKEAQMKEMHKQIEILKELLQNTNHNVENIPINVIQEEKEPASSEKVQVKMMESDQFIETKEFTETKVAKTQFEIFQDRFTELSDHYEDILFQNRELSSNLEEYFESRNENERLVHEIMDTINPAGLIQRDMKSRLDKVNMLRAIIKHNNEVIAQLQKELADNEDMKNMIKNQLESLYKIKFIKECQGLQNFQLYSSLEREKQRLQETIHELVTNQIKQKNDDTTKEMLICKLEDELAYVKGKVIHNEAILEMNKDLIKSKSCGRCKSNINVRQSMFVGSSKIYPKNEHLTRNMSQVTSKYLQFQTFVPSSNISVNKVREKSANQRNSMFNPSINTRIDIEEQERITIGCINNADINNIDNEMQVEYQFNPITKDYEEFKRQKQNTPKMKTNDNQSCQYQDIPHCQQNTKSSFLETQQHTGIYPETSVCSTSSLRQLISKQQIFLRRSELTHQEYEKMIKSESTQSSDLNNNTTICKSTNISSRFGLRENSNNPIKIKFLKDESQKSYFSDTDSGTPSVTYENSTQIISPIHQYYKNQNHYQNQSYKNSLNTYTTSIPNNENYKNSSSIDHHNQTKEQQKLNSIFQISTPIYTRNKHSKISSVSPCSHSFNITNDSVSKPLNNLSGIITQTLSTFKLQGKPQSAYKVNSNLSMYSTNTEQSTNNLSNNAGQSFSQKNLNFTSFNDYQKNNSSHGVVNVLQQSGSPKVSQLQGAHKILQVPTTAISLNFDSN